MNSLKSLLITVLLCFTLLSVGRCQKIELLDQEQIEHLHLSETDFNTIQQSLEDCKKVLGYKNIETPAFFSTTLIVEKKYKGAYLIKSTSDNTGMSVNIQKQTEINAVSDIQIENRIAFDNLTGLYVVIKDYSFTKDGCYHLVSYIFNSDESFNRIIENVFNKELSTVRTYYGSFIEPKEQTIKSSSN